MTYTDTHTHATAISGLVETETTTYLRTTCDINTVTEIRTEYYIDLTGDDTTGNGTLALPWKTFTKALLMADAGDTINAADGTYAEDTSGGGLWSISKNVSSYITIQPTLGAGGDVTVAGASDAIQNTLITGTTSHLRFKYIKFGARAGSRYCFRINAAATYLDFQYCTFSHDTAYSTFYFAPANVSISDVIFSNCTFAATGNTYNITLQPTGTGTASVTFTDCTVAGALNRLVSFSQAFITISGGTWTLTGGTSANAFRGDNTTLSITGATITSAATTGSTIHNSQTTVIGNLTNCIVSATGDGAPISWVGGTINITGGTYTANRNGKAIYLGVDGETGNATTVNILGGTANKPSGTGHAVLVGAGCTGTVDGLVITEPSSDYGMVVKENAGVTIQNCDITSGSSGGLYLKAAVNAIIYNNTLTGQGGGAAFTLLVGDTGNTSSGCTITYNHMNVIETSDIFNWGTTGDGDNNINDYNVYHVGGTGNYGTVRGDGNVVDLTELRAAWTGYTNETNDANSTAV